MLLQEREQAAEAARAEAAMKRATMEKDHMRRLEAVRDSNRRKTLRDTLAWLKQAARAPFEANMQRSVIRAWPGTDNEQAHLLRLETAYDRILIAYICFSACPVHVDHAAATSIPFSSHLVVSACPCCHGSWVSHSAKRDVLLML